jgi:hypothetical protein
VKKSKKRRNGSRIFTFFIWQMRKKSSGKNGANPAMETLRKAPDKGS